MSNTQSIKVNVPLEMTPPDSFEYDEESGEKYPTGATFEEQIVAKAANQLAKRAEKALKEKLDKIIDTKVNEIVERIVVVQVERALAEGWLRHDQWGTPVGERITLKERIMKILEEPKKQNNFDRSSKTIVQMAIEDAVKQTMDKELKSEIEKARAELRKKLDLFVTNQFVETIKRAMGLR